MDSFYKEPELLPGQTLKDFNWDNPQAIDTEQCEKVLIDLLNGKNSQIPIYDFVKCKAVGSKEIKPTPIIIFEGIFALNIKKIRDMMNLKIFVHTDDDVRLARRLERDIIERGRSIDSVIAQYNRFVKPSHDLFIHPCMKFADIIIPSGVENGMSIDFICQNLKMKLKTLGVIRSPSQNKLVQDEVVDFEIVESHKDIAMHGKCLTAPSEQDIPKLKLMLFKFLKGVDIQLHDDYRTLIIEKLFSLDKGLKGTPIFIGSKMKEGEYAKIGDLLGSGKDAIVFYTSLINTDNYISIIKNIISKVRDQVGNLKVCCIFSDENCSKDLGRYDKLQIYTIYYSNYLKMFQIMFDNEESLLYEKIIEASYL